MLNFVVKFGKNIGVLPFVFLKHFDRLPLFDLLLLAPAFGFICRMLGFFTCLCSTHIFVQS